MVSQNRGFNKGFSLLEMTVVLAIVGIMTVIILFNLPQMKGGLSIDLIAQEIAIYVRGAQVYSRATRVIGGGGSSFSSYGLHFTKDSSEFFLWADSNGSVDGDNGVANYQYTSGDSGDTKQETYNLPAGFSISKLICGTGVGIVSLDSLDIVFRLPDPEANFAGYPLDSGANPCVNELKVSVCLESANQRQWRVVDVYNNGQIAVRKPIGTECSR